MGEAHLAPGVVEVQLDGSFRLWGPDGVAVGARRRVASDQRHRRRCCNRLARVVTSAATGRPLRHEARVNANRARRSLPPPRQPPDRDRFGDKAVVRVCAISAARMMIPSSRRRVRLACHEARDAVARGLLLFKLERAYAFNGRRELEPASPGLLLLDGRTARLGGVAWHRCRGPATPTRCGRIVPTRRSGGVRNRTAVLDCGRPAIARRRLLRFVSGGRCCFTPIPATAALWPLPSVLR